MSVIYTFIHAMDFLKVDMLSIVKNHKCISGSDFEGETDLWLELGLNFLPLNILLVRLIKNVT